VIQENSATRLYGREREIALVENLINRAGSKGSAIVVRGEARNQLRGALEVDEPTA